MQILDREIKPVLPVLTIASLITNILDKIVQKIPSNINFDSFLVVITIALVIFLIVQILDYFRDNLVMGSVLVFFIALLTLVKFVFPTYFTLVFIIEMILAFLLGNLLLNFNRNRTQNIEQHHNIRDISSIVILGSVILLFAGFLAYFAQDKVIDYSMYFVPSFCLLCIEAAIITRDPAWQNFSSNMTNYFFKFFTLIALLAIIYIIWVIWYVNHTNYSVVLATSVICLAIIFWPQRSIAR